jgi:hypothetical protein
MIFEIMTIIINIVVLQQHEKCCYHTTMKEIKTTLRQRPPLPERGARGEAPITTIILLLHRPRKVGIIKGLNKKKAAYSVPLFNQ